MAATAQAEERLVRHGADERLRDHRAFGGHQCAQKNVQRQQHECDADEHPAQVARAGSAAALEGDHAGHQEHGRHHRDIERQHLHDQRGADIGTEHRRERGDQLETPADDEGAHHQTGRGAALKHRRHEGAGEESPEAVL